MWPVKQLDSYVPIWEDCQDVWKVGNIQNNRNIMISFCEKGKQIICVDTLNVSEHWVIWYGRRIYFNAYMFLFLFVVVIVYLFATFLFNYRTLKTNAWKIVNSPLMHRIEKWGFERGI